MGPFHNSVADARKPSNKDVSSDEIVHLESLESQKIDMDCYKDIINDDLPDAAPYMGRDSFPSDALQSILELQDSSLFTMDMEPIADHRLSCDGILDGAPLYKELSLCSKEPIYSEAQSSNELLDSPYKIPPLYDDFWDDCPLPNKAFSDHFTSGSEGSRRTTYPPQYMPEVGEDDLALYTSKSAPQAPFIPGGAAAITSQHVHVGLSATPTHYSSSAQSTEGLASNEPDHGMPPAWEAARQPARPGRRAARSLPGGLTPKSSGRRRRRSPSPDPSVATSGILATEIPSADENHTRKRQKCNAAKTPTSKYTGVTWHKGNKKFRATIYYLQCGDDKAKPKHLGYSESDLEAARWYDEVTLIVRTKPKTNISASNYASKEELRAKWEKEMGPLPVPDHR